MSSGRVITIVSMVVMVLLLFLLVDAGTDVEVLGLSVPVWGVASLSYLLGWTAAFGNAMRPRSDDEG